MTQLTIRWPQGEQTFPGDKTIRVGRSAECDILVLDERVSRNPHLELALEGGVWVLEDRSRGGTWFQGSKVERVSVATATTFHLGAPDGPELTLIPGVPAEPPAAAGAPGGERNADGLAGGDGKADTGAGDGTDAGDGAALLAAAAEVTAGGMLTAEPPAPPASAPAPPTPPTPPAPPTAPPDAGPPPPPAGTPPARPFDPTATVSIDDRALRLSYEDQEHLVPPGFMITIGRDPGCQLVVDSPIVSRQHCRFVHDGTDWLLEDLGSTRGTYVDGRRVTTPYRAQGVFEVSLGDDDAGEKVRVVTAGEHATPRSRTPLLLAGLALVLAVAGIGVAVAMGGDDGDTIVEQTTVNEGGREANTEEQLATVKGSTVMIEALIDGVGIWTGSGTVISEEGHILTNAHVADPQAESLDALVPLLGGLEDRTPADGFVIYVSEGEDEPAEPRYEAEWVASSDEQDASVIQITRDLETGDRVDTVPLTPIPIGTSSSLRAGQKIHSLGYPANATTYSISVLEGEVVSFVSASEFRNIVGGDRRKVMNTSAVLGQGSSGGPIVRDGEIVGLNATLSTGDGLDRGWAVPIDEIIELLDDVGIPHEG